MTRDIIQAIKALRWRNGSTRSSDTSVTKITYSSLSLAVAVGMGAGMRARNFGGSGKPITLFALIARGVRYAQAPLWGAIVWKKLTSRANLRQLLLQRVFTGGLTRPAFNGKLVQCAIKSIFLTNRSDMRLTFLLFNLIQGPKTSVVGGTAV